MGFDDSFDFKPETNEEVMAWENGTKANFNVGGATKDPAGA